MCVHADSLLSRRICCVEQLLLDTMEVQNFLYGLPILWAYHPACRRIASAGSGIWTVECVKIRALLDLLGLDSGMYSPCLGTGSSSYLSVPTVGLGLRLGQEADPTHCLIGQVNRIDVS